MYLKYTTKYIFIQVQIILEGRYAYPAECHIHVHKHKKFNYFSENNYALL